MRKLRELRKTQDIRDKQAQVSLKVKDLIYPYFVVEGTGVKKEIPSLKNVYHFSIDKLIEDLKEVTKLGLNKILLFGVIENDQKNSTGMAAYSENNIVVKAVKAIKEKYSKLIVITDVCLDRKSVV